MDTREKIKSLTEAAALIDGGGWAVAMGVFDPFTVEVARSIRERRSVSQKLLVIVAPGLETLLSVEARAALVAALRGVDAVAIAEPDAARAALGGTEILEDAATDAARSQAFVDFMRERLAMAGKAG